MQQRDTLGAAEVAGDGGEHPLREGGAEADLFVLVLEDNGVLARRVAAIDGDSILVTAVADATKCPVASRSVRTASHIPRAAVGDHALPALVKD